MLYLGGDDGWVRKDLVPTALGDPSLKPGAQADPNAKRINNGVVGDARRSSAMLGKQFFDHIAQAGRLFAEHDSTATIHHQHAIHLSSTHSQLHRRFFSDIRSKTQFKSLPRLTRPCKRRP